MSEPFCMSPQEALAAMKIAHEDEPGATAEEFAEALETFPDNRGLSAEQRDILHHAIHRAAGGLYCGDSPDMRSLVAARFMESAGRKSFVPDEYFRITAAGRQALKLETLPAQICRSTNRNGRN